jgi:hypothetical protein
MMIKVIMVVVVAGVWMEEVILAAGWFDAGISWLAVGDCCGGGGGGGGASA